MHLRFVAENSRQNLLVMLVESFVVEDKQTAYTLLTKFLIYIIKMVFTKCNYPVLASNVSVCNVI